MLNHPLVRQPPQISPNREVFFDWEGIVWKRRGATAYTNNS